MKKQLFLLLFILTSITFSSEAQNDKPRKAIYGAFMGNAPIASVNYDTRIGADPNFGLGFSVGLSGSASHYGRKDVTMGLPLALNYLLGKDHHALELGLAGTPEFRLKKSDYSGVGTPPASPAEKSAFFHGHFNIGYRFQPIKEKGVMFKILWTPAISFKKDGYYSYDQKRALTNFGVGVGYSFK